jgi:hypothetical protein
MEREGEKPAGFEDAVGLLPAGRQEPLIEGVGILGLASPVLRRAR